MSLFRPLLSFGFWCSAVADEESQIRRSEYSSEPGFLHPGEYLADLECRSPQFAHWGPLIEKIKSLSDVELQFPPLDFAEHVSNFFNTIVRGNESEQLQLISFFTEYRNKNPDWLLNISCSLGTTTIYYIAAWLAAREDDWQVAGVCIRAALASLQSDSLDLLDESFWPWKSRDVHTLKWRIQHRDSIQDHSVFPMRTFRPDIPSVQLPMVWPEIRAARETCEHKRVVAWWISKHHAPIADFHDALDLYAPRNWQVELRANMVSEYCKLNAAQGYCSRDETLLQIMKATDILFRQSQEECGDDKPQWCGILELNADFDAVSAEFARHYHYLEQEVDVFICSHPLFWCQLFSSFSAPVLGIMDLQHLGFVPQGLQEDWTRRFLDMFFGQQRNLLVACGVYTAFASNWLLDIRLPYVTKTSLRLARFASLEATYSLSVLINTANVRFHDRLIQSYIAGLPDFPLSLFRWPADLDCGRDCSKAELAKYQAVVLWPYDTMNLKLTEFYTLRLPIFVKDMKWHTTLSWGYADAQYAGGPPATVWKHNETGFDFHSWQATASCNPWKAMKEHPLPYTPFPDKSSLYPDGLELWSRLTDWNLLPHIFHYASLAHLAQGLMELDRVTVSADMDRFASRLAFEVANFWLEAVGTLLDPSSSLPLWRGS